MFIIADINLLLTKISNLLETGIIFRNSLQKNAFKMPLKLLPTTCCSDVFEFASTGLTWLLTLGGGGHKIAYGYKEL